MHFEVGPGPVIDRILAVTEDRRPEDARIDIDL